jgi:hypothetical protein
MELHGYVMTTITLITKYEFNLKPQFQILWTTSSSSHK